MREAGIGRVLAASLHQGIADLLPTRLEFYEHWLNPDGLRHGTIGLAPLAAVLSFLRQEGEPYGRVVRRAGTYAAEWLLAPRRLQRSPVVRALPAGMRGRIALGTARRLIRACYRGSGAVVRLRRGTGTLQIQGSVFCSVREPAAEPLCGFYEALTVRVLQAYGLDAIVHAVACRGAGAQTCELSVDVVVRDGVATAHAESPAEPTSRATT
jgi:bacteriochlorophyll 4-vinyl reductase